MEVSSKEKLYVLETARTLCEGIAASLYKVCPKGERRVITTIQIRPAGDKNWETVVIRSDSSSSEESTE